MDTTSHNFTFETFTFGGNAGSCTLYDVAIIDENYIIAVGTIYFTDTIGQPDPQPYGAAIWDGQSWELKKLFYNTNIPVTPRGIFVISPTEIYLASGSIFKWDGSSSTVQLVYSRLNLPDPNATIEKLWGNSSSSIYGVGNIGSIVFYNGQSWQRIESGTELIIRDVWGVIEKENNQRKVFCTVLSSVALGEHKILTIDENNKVDSLHWDTGRIVTSSWTKEGKFIYTSGWGVFSNKSGRWIEERTIPLFYTNRVRGNGLNDIVVVGNYGFLAHNNGKNWKVYDEFLQMTSADFYSVAVNTNTIVVVGYDGEKALTILGKKI